MAARRLVPSSLFSLAAALALASGASAFDLTGTWAGRWSCQGYDGSKFRSSSKDSVLRVTQTGSSLAVDLDDGLYRYNGGAIFDDKSPTTKGEIALVQCGTDNVPFDGPEGEIVRAKVKADAAKGTGSLKGVSLVEFSDIEITDVLTCKYSYKRISTEDPAVPPCAVP